jgi:hypothetical protein
VVTRRAVRAGSQNRRALLLSPETVGRNGGLVRARRGFYLIRAAGDGVEGMERPGVDIAGIYEFFRPAELG